MTDDAPENPPQQPGDEPHGTNPGTPEYPPPGGGHYPPPPGYYQPPKKRKAWPWVLGGVIGVFVLLFGGYVAFVVLVGQAPDSDEPTVSSASETNQPDSGGRGPDFPGKQPTDTATNAGDSVTINGVTTTTSPLFNSTSQFGSDYLCTTVTITNDSNQTDNYNAWDWSLQDPSGTAWDLSFTGSDTQLSSGEVAANGGSTSGDVCFDDPQGSPRGTSVVLFDSVFSSSSDRIAWINRR